MKHDYNTKSFLLDCVKITFVKIIKMVGNSLVKTLILKMKMEKVTFQMLQLFLVEKASYCAVPSPTFSPICSDVGFLTGSFGSEKIIDS